MALTRLQDTEQAAKDVERLAQDIEKLRSSYEQYFLGLEKREPSDLRAAVVNQIRKYASSPIQNARLKFRYQQSVARYNTYTTYWDRILREIEEGRYVREVFKAKIHEESRGVAPKEPPPKPAPVASKTDPVAVLFEKFVASRQKTNESVKGLSLEAFRKTIQTQMEVIKKKTSAASVKFQIAVEDGKTKLKAIPQTKKKPG